MSNKAVGWAFELDLEDPPAKLVLLILADHWREDTESAWPSVARISRISGADDRTVQRALARLIKRKVVKREKRPGTSSIFRLIYDPRQNDVPPVSHPRHNVTAPPSNLSPHPRQNDTLSSHRTSQLTSEKKINGGGKKDMIADDEPWEARVRAFAKTRFWMPHHWGPRPNEKGCRAPSQFIEEFLK